MKNLPIPAFILALSSLVFGCHGKDEKHETEEHGHKIVVTTPLAKDVVSTQRYVCQIHSRRHIEVRALETGYLEEVKVQEGQSVKKDDEMFRIIPVLFQANLETEAAEAKLAQIKFETTKLLSDKSIVSEQELALARAERAKALAKVKKARAELNFTSLKAPFDGIVDRQRAQQGSLVEEGDILSTLSDNQVMWVYFNVPEARYLDYRARMKEDEAGMKIQLQLANGDIFPQEGKIGAIEADFNNETGNIPFRADFDNPEALLRHGQTGTILVHRPLHDAIVIPQRATYEILAKRYVFVIEPKGGETAAHETASHETASHETEGATHEAAAHGDDGAKEEHHPKKGSMGRGVVRQREIVVQEEMEDIFVIKKGLTVTDHIIFEGIQQVRDGDEIEYELRSPEEILQNTKFHAE
ncbi:MAG: efflux RND transporter periplasmic adaptor subunit [Myxococcales bacterium]|nr:efflux RND transporter periplasmic adaptor subunit [Myxococcales bacterium]